MGRPVFHMCLEIHSKHTYGYVFPSEVDESYVSTVFTIPLEEGEGGEDIIKHTYELLGTLKGEEETYALQHVGELFVLSHPNLARPIRFSIYNPYDPLGQRTYPFIRSFPYVGQKKDVVEPYTHFVPVMPIDVQIMDEVCEKYGMVFVGKTDLFPSK